MTDQPSFELFAFWRTSATYRVRVAIPLKGLTATEMQVDAAGSARAGELEGWESRGCAARPVGANLSASREMPRAGESSKSMRHRLNTVTVVATIALATSASAQGLAIKDLTDFGQATSSALGTGFEARVEPQRITLVCMTCEGEPVVDVLIGRQADGTEERVRSGATSMADLQQICRRRSPQCTVAKLDVAPAVGWVSGYPLGDRAGATAVIIRDGDLLTVRSLAKNPASARHAIDRLLPLIRTRVVGR